MNIFHIENLRVELHKSLSNTASVNIRIFLIYDFFDLLLKSNLSLTESYFHEFLPPYLMLINKYNALYKNPSLTKNLIKQLSDINSSITPVENYDAITGSLNSKLQELNNILIGKNKTSPASQIYFPVLEKEFEYYSFGFLESITIEIKKSQESNQFIIIPSEQEIENNIENQVRLSWDLAVNILKRYFHRLSKFHKVIIHFNNRLGFYEGNSLGVALTLSFIEELFLFYNANHSVKTKTIAAFTGSINNQSTIFPLSEDIIKKKTEVLFYSKAEMFVVPEENKKCAVEELIKLNKFFPERKLEVIGVESLYDLLNRRNIIEINRKSTAVRTGSFVKKQWLPLSLLTIIAVMVYLTGILDFDKNPYRLVNSGSRLIVLNKNDKVIWSQIVGYDIRNNYAAWFVYTHQKIVDINDDGTNEVLVCKETAGNEDAGSIFCYDNNGNEIWKYRFKDTVSVSFEYISPTFRTRIIGDAVYKGEKLLFLTALHDPNSTSAIYSLNLKTGKRTGGLLWHHGHYTRGLIGDFNEDGIDEIVMSGINNCLERCVIFSIDIDKINGRAPSRKQWEYYGYNLADFNKYVLLPKTDLNNHLELRFNHPSGNLQFDKRSKEFGFSLCEDLESTMNIGYDCNRDLEKIRATVADKFQVVRDSLVANGELNPPYTDTKEYIDILLSDIEYLVNKSH